MRCTVSSRTCWATSDDVLALFTNHPKQGDIGAFNQALCGLWAAGLGFEAAAGAAQTTAAATAVVPTPPAAALVRPVDAAAPTAAAAHPASP